MCMAVTSSIQGIPRQTSRAQEGHHPDFGSPSRVSIVTTQRGYVHQTVHYPTRLICKRQLSRCHILADLDVDQMGQ